MRHSTPCCCPGKAGRAIRPPIRIGVMLPKELKRPGVTLALLWLEYRQVEPEGYSYSRFCELYGAWRKTAGATFRNRHRAGEMVQSDYAGQRVLVFDPILGRLREAQIFVAVLGASSLHLCRGDLEPEPAGLDRLAHARFRVLWRGAQRDRLRQPEVRRHQAALVRSRRSTGPSRTWRLTTTLRFCRRGSGSRATRQKSKSRFRW